MSVITTWAIPVMHKLASIKKVIKHEILQEQINIVYYEK